MITDAVRITISRRVRRYGAHTENNKAMLQATSTSRLTR